NPYQLAHDPELLLRLFEFAGRHGFRLAGDTERRIAESLRELTIRLKGGERLWPLLRRLLSLEEASVALRSMQENGVLRALIPEWSQIECLVVRDFYHRYTVDEHTLVALEILD